MADANIFAQYLRPIRSVDEQRADMDARDLRREQLLGAQRQNALAALAAQQTQDQMAQSVRERNMLRQLAQKHAGNPQAFEDALAGSGEPGLMTQAEARRKARMEAASTDAGTRYKQAETIGKLLTAQGELATRVMATPTRQAALASVRNMRMMAQALGVDIDMSEDEMTASQLQDGDQVKQWAAGLALKAEKLLPTIQRFGAGDRDVTQAVDPVTGAVREVSSTPIGQSRDNAATVAATIRGQNLTDARAREGMAQAERLARQAVTYQTDANGNIVALPSKAGPKDGMLRAIPVAAPGGGLTPLQGKPSDAVQKEQMSINQQRAMIDGAIKAVKETPSAFGFTRGAATLAGTIPESIAGRMDSDEERQARAFVFNNVSAVINERAGAAQSKQELARLRSFLPGETDSSDQVVSKMEAFVKYLGEKERGTTTAKPTAKPSPQPPQVSGAFKILGSK